MRKTIDSSKLSFDIIHGRPSTRLNDKIIECGFQEFREGMLNSIARKESWSLDELAYFAGSLKGLYESAQI